jgi:lipoyl(octanoyl) transferase
MDRVPELWVCHLGIVPYAEALALQERVRAARIAGRVPDVLLSLEHPPVFTRGRRSGAEDLGFPLEWYAQRGATVFDVDRGGKVTYHGPGQLVGYPIVAVDDVVAYVRLLERAIVRALAEEGVAAFDRATEGPDYTGVWVDRARPRKIASIGVHVSRGVTTHGYAVNVENSLEPFGWVVACGLPEVTMTSLAQEAGATGARLPCFRKRMAFAVAAELGLRQRLLTRPALERALGGLASGVTAGGVAASGVAAAQAASAPLLLSADA